jgi:nucleoside-diphosphate-sugar epimerase/glycosyltransferase involved in cell wall biosynthesis
MLNEPFRSTDWARALRGPIAVLGAGGFIGANLFRRILASRSDVFGVTWKLPPWRLEGIDKSRLLEVDMTNGGEIRTLVDYVQPATIFNCISYGAYSFETKTNQIYETNFLSLVKLVELLDHGRLAALIHTGSSSEYGLNCAAPAESAVSVPNSNYAVSKAAAHNFVSYAGKCLGLPVANLRLYSVYGPYEDTSRLIPNIVRCGLNGGYPEFVSPDISRDFVYIDDVCDAFLMAAARLTPELYGEAFNIGTGQRTTIREVAEIAQHTFGIDAAPTFGNMPNRAWDLGDWYANPAKAKNLLGWSAKTPFAEGLRLTSDWFRSLDPLQMEKMSKRSRSASRRSITAIVACYMDEQAIPVMYERLVATFKKLDVGYEIIFVNDASPDNSAEAILKLTAHDKNVVGITHSRNFGSQMAFRSGMELANKDGVVLLDGDLQDPPELIEQLYQKWIEGYDVVYGVRVKREMPRLWGYMYKGFYRIFSAFSYIDIPHDAGDFSLIDERVVSWLLRCPERDLFLRGLRAYVGFKQVGVNYTRPERMFGKSTNSLFKNLAWAKRGIFSFSDVPITMLTASGIALLGLCMLLALAQIFLRIYAPNLVPPGVTTILLTILFFGSINVFAVGLLGEYIAKIMHEVKGRPRFIRASIIRRGEVTQLLPKSEPKGT